MSKINMFAVLSKKSANVPASTPQSDAPQRDKNAWRNDPIAVPGSGQRAKQFVTLTRLLRSKDLLQISDPAIRTLVANVAVFDDETGHWTELPKLTKGQASDLIDTLIKLPNVGFSKVETSQAEPISEPTAEPSMTLPAGYEVRIGKRGPYLAKIK